MALPERESAREGGRERESARERERERERARERKSKVLIIPSDIALPEGERERERKRESERASERERVNSKQCIHRALGHDLDLQKKKKKNCMSIQKKKMH